MSRELLQSFIDSFVAGLSAEMFAMQKKLGPYELALSGMRELENLEEFRLYGFTAKQPSDKLVAQLECTLRADTAELPVRIASISEEELVLRSEGEIPANASNYSLIVYPWFLYERLKLALLSILQSDTFFPESGLRLFGKLPPLKLDWGGELPDGTNRLNEAQSRALELSMTSSPALIWGPPGSGKTTTLGAIVSEQLRAGRRLLIASTTNAAIDQVLEVLARSGAASAAGPRGIVRIGTTRAATYGASLAEILEELGAAARSSLRALRERREAQLLRIKECRRILQLLEKESRDRQVSLFAVAGEQASASGAELEKLFSSRRAARAALLGIPGRREIVSRLQARLERSRALSAARIRAEQEREQGRAAEVVAGARVVLATLSNLTVSKLLENERFDTVIVDEAGMAILPAIFYCACLARGNVIAAGDPKQLPAIVQGEGSFVHKVLARSIFEIAAPAGRTVMLDIQYRMHPEICRLVGDVFYGGALKSAPGLGLREELAARRPFRNAALTLVDTVGRTSCQTRDGSFSRFSPESARLCVELGREALADGFESIGIITPYHEQAKLIGKLIEESGLPPGRLECATVHRFQGNERDLIIFDAVDSEPLRPGVLLSGAGPRSSAANLINVSISRARGKLVIVADRGYFETKAGEGILTEVLRRAESGGALIVRLGEELSVPI